MVDKKNDWLATMLFQPNMDFQDFANNDITPDNTSLRGREYYKNNDEVVQIFTENGKFNDKKFEDFYKSALSMYNVFANEQFENKLLETYDYDLFDYFAPKGANLKDNLPRIASISNPERRSFGLTNIRGVGDATMSVREVAQQNKVFNYDTQEFEDWTPEDKGGIFKALTRPTLVLASWDEDGEHIFQGRKVRHNKGDLKFNDSGETYYETLGDREIYGKQILNYTDTLTKEGTWLNKYDFFDSDGLDKSTAGTIAKLVFTVGPMLIPHVGSIYGAATAAINLSQLIPTVLKSINGIAGISQDSAYGNVLNKAEGYFSRYNSSVSDYSQENLVSFENLGQLVQDVSLQLFQQRVIGQIPGFLSKAPTSVRTRKLGQRMSLAYMAGTSSQEVYSEFKDAGATDAVAGLGMLASIGAMYKLMTMDYFRDMLFRGTYLDESPVKEAVKALAQAEKANFAKLAQSTPQESAKWVLGSMKFLQKAAMKVSASPIISRSVNEAVEEVLEEVSQDTIKALFKGANALGIKTNEDNSALDFGFTPQDFIQRYAMSFFGGAIGGPIFELHDRWQNRLKGISNKMAQTTPNEAMQEMVYLVREGRAEEIKDHLEILRNKGKLGDKNLSGLRYEVDYNDSDKPIKFHQSESGESQNDVIYQQLVDYVDRIDQLLSYEGLKVPDAVLQQFELSREAGIPYDAVSETLLHSGIHSRVFQDFNDLGVRIIQTTAKLNELYAPASTESADPKSTEQRADIMANSKEAQILQSQLDNYRNQLNDILSGNRNDYYFGQALFALDSAVNSGFVTLSKEDYTLSNYGRTYNSLSEDQRNEVDQNYEEYINLNGREKVFKAYDTYLALNEHLQPALIKANELLKNTKSDIYGLGVINYNGIYNIKQAITELENKIHELENEEEPNVEQIEELTLHLNQLQEAYKSYEQNFSLFVEPELSMEAEEILQRPLSTQIDYNQLNNYAQGILDLYTHAQRNNIAVDPGDADLNILLNNFKKLLAETETTMFGKYQDYIDSWLKQEDDVVLNLESNEEGLVSFDFNSYAQRHLNSVLTSLESNLGVNTQQALSDWNEVVQIFRDSKLPTERTDEILQIMQPEINGQPLIEYIKTYYDTKANNIVSPIFELLDSFSTYINGKENNLLKLLLEEQFKFTNSKTTEDYIIENKDVEQELEQLKSFTKALKSILDGSTNYNDEGGLNSNINTKRQSLGKPDLPQIDLSTAFILNSELGRLEQKLDYLLQLSKVNSNQKLRTNTEIAIQAKKKFLDYLVADNSLIKEKFNNLFTVDLDEIWSEFEFNGDVNADTYGEFEKAVINFETALFERIYGRFSNDELANNLISLFNPDELYKQVSTKLTTDITGITDYDMLVYLATILTVPSNNFYSQLKEAITSEEYDKAPIFSQEYSVRIGHAMETNKELFNLIVDQLMDNSINVDNYIKEKSRLYNFHLTFGGAGTGKTTSIGYLLKLLNQNNSSFITLAPSMKQAENLSRSLKLENNKQFTRDDFMVEILGRNIVDSDYIDSTAQQNGHLQLKPNLIPATNELFDPGKKKILFIDEITIFNEPQLQLISKWALANNVMVYAFGDIKQNVMETQIGTNVVYGGIEDTFHIKSPNLTSTLRANNIAKNQNYNALSVILDSVFDKYYDNPSLTVLALSNITDNVLSESNLTLRYFETENQFVGEKIVKTDDELLRLTKIMKELSSDVALITDNPTKYQTLKDVKVISLQDVQGSEFDYVLIDKKWNANSFTTLRDFYTLTQRSRLGSVILDNKVTDILSSLSSKFDATVNTVTELSQDQINEFKNWRIGALEGVESNPEYNNLSYDSTTYTPEAKTTDIPSEVEAVKTEWEKNKEVKVDSNLKSEPNPENDNSTSQSLLPEIKSENSLSNNIQSESTTEVLESNEMENVAKEDKTQTNGTQSLQTKPKVSNQPFSKSIPQPIYRDTKETLFLSNDNFFDWMSNDLWTYDRADDNLNSIYNVYKLKDKISKEQYQRLVKTLSGYYKFGYYKNPRKSSQQISQLLNIIYPNNAKVTNPIRNNLTNFTFNIIPYGNGSQGLMVSTILIGENKLNIPLFITSPNFGQYTGEFELVQGPRFITGDEGVLHYVKDLDPSGMFSFHSEYIIPVVDERKVQIEDEGVNNFLYRRKNNGKAFALFTDDPVVNTTAFNRSLAPTLSSDRDVIYLTQGDEKFALMGVQNNMEFSKVVELSRERVQELRSQLAKVPRNDNQGKNQVFMEYDRDRNKWVVYKTRSAEFLTEIINLSKVNADIKKSLFNSMYEYLTTKAYDDLDTYGSPSMIFDLKVFNDVTGQVETKSYILRQNSVQGTGTDSRMQTNLVLYDFRNQEMGKESLLSVPLDYNNLYNIIAWIGEQNNLNFDNGAPSDLLLTSLASYNVTNGKVFALSPNRTIELVTRNIGNLDMLNDVFTEIPKFKNGIYAQDNKGTDKISNYIFPLANPKSTYRTDVSKLTGSVFAINRNNIVKSKFTPQQEAENKKVLDFNNKINQLKTELKSNGLSYNFELSHLDLNQLAKENSLDQLYDFTIEQMNREFREKATDFSYKQYGQDRFITVIDHFQLIENLLHNYGEVPVQFDRNSIEILDDDILDFVPFYVSLGNERVGYNIQKTNEKWELFNFTSIGSYEQLLNFYRKNENGIGQFLTNNIESYVLGLFENIEITSDQSLNYYQEIQTLSSNPLVNELNTLINNYLLERLQNNEC